MKYNIYFEGQFNGLKEQELNEFIDCLRWGTFFYKGWIPSHFKIEVH